MPDNRLPPVLTIKRGNFEKVFKILLQKMIADNKIDINDLRNVNQEMVKWLITGMQNVDFENDFGNNVALNNLVDELWKNFYRDLNMKVRKHRTKFRRRQF